MKFDRKQERQMLAIQKRQDHQALRLLGSTLDFTDRMLLNILEKAIKKKR